MKQLGTQLLVGGIVATLGVGAWLLFASDAAPAPQARPPFVIPVSLAPVEAREVAPRVRLSGTVRAVRRAQLGFQVAGVVSAIHAQAGETVTRGQPLAALDDREQAYAVHIAQAELELRQSVLAKLEAGERAEDIRRLAGELEVARADLRVAEIEVQRNRKLLEREVIGQADIDRLVAVQQAAQGRLQAAQELLAAAEAGPRIEDIGVARADVQRARGQLERAQLDRDRAVLRAPWEGVVRARAVSVGDYANVGAMAFELVDPGTLEVLFDIPSAYGTRLAERGLVRLTVDELPGFELEVPLAYRIPVADTATRNYTGVLRLDPSQSQRLEPGLYVRLDLPLRPITDHPVVPSDSVRRTDQGFAVARAVPAGADAPTPLATELIPVRVVGADARGSAVAPLSGELNPGDQVVVTGAYRVFPGAAIAPQQVAEQEAP